MPTIPAPRRRRRRRLRADLAPQRRRIDTASRRLVERQRTAIVAEPDAASTATDTAKLVKELRALSRTLRRRADGDAAVTAAANGVAHLADAYELIGTGDVGADAAAAYEQVKRSRKALRAAERDRKRAGDAWPL